MAGEVIGGIRFRAAMNEDVELYAGNLGYNVDPPYRGRHFAERACRLLLPFARLHCFEHLWITFDPANAESRRTCERLGAVLVEVIMLPEDLIRTRTGSGRSAGTGWIRVRALGIRLR